MYEGPLMVITKQVADEMAKQLDDLTFCAIREVGVDVNKEELLKALRYDRRQYEKGYADGLAQCKQWISVNERLPEDGIPVLAYYERNAWPEGCNAPVRKKEIGVGWHVDGMWHVDGCSKVVGIAWIPLPEPPKEET